MSDDGEGPGAKRAKSILDEETRDHIADTLRFVQHTFNLGAATIDFIRGVIYGIVIEQQRRMAKRTEAAFRIWVRTAEPEPIMKIIAFTRGAGRWHTAQRLKAMRAKMREDRERLDAAADILAELRKILEAVDNEPLTTAARRWRAWCYDAQMREQRLKELIEELEDP